MSNEIRKMVLVPSSNTNNMSVVNPISVGTTSASLMTSNSKNDNKQQPTSLLENPFSKRLINLDRGMEEILNDSTISEDEKLARYLLLLRSFLMLRAKLSGESSDPIPVKIVEKKFKFEDWKPEEKTIPPFEVKDPIPMSSFNPQFDSKIQEYAKTNLIKNIHNTMKSRAKVLLDALSENKHFSWNKKTGVISIKNKLLPEEANIKDFVLYTIRNESPLISQSQYERMSQPKYYDLFEQFLNDEKISSLKQTRGTTKAAAVQALSKKYKKVIKGPSPLLALAASPLVSSDDESEALTSVKRKSRKRKIPVDSSQLNETVD